MHERHHNLVDGWLLGALIAVAADVCITRELSRGLVLQSWSIALLFGIKCLATLVHLIHWHWQQEVWMAWSWLSLRPTQSQRVRLLMI